MGMILGETDWDDDIVINLPKMQRHCIHAGEAPGHFHCCSCWMMTTGFVGDSRSRFDETLCIKARGAWLRHRNLWPSWTLKERGRIGS